MGFHFFQAFKQMYSGKVINVVLMYRKYTESVSLFKEKLETLMQEKKLILYAGTLI